jgi:hypothetical protein
MIVKSTLQIGLENIGDKVVDFLGSLPFIEVSSTENDLKNIEKRMDRYNLQHRRSLLFKIQQNRSLEHWYSTLRNICLKESRFKNIEIISQDLSLGEIAAQITFEEIKFQFILKNYGKEFTLKYLNPKGKWKAVAMYHDMYDLETVYIKREEKILDAAHSFIKLGYAVILQKIIKEKI